MSVQLGNIKQIPLSNLIIDLTNPRYDPRKSQREALYTIAHEQKEKLINLAQDIFDKGLNLSDLPMVTPVDDDTFIVLEGNRRIAALKIISSQSLLESLGLPQKLTKKLKDLCESAKDELPTQITCVVMTREDANYWIQLKHTGENEGVGIVRWDGRASHRFRGNSPALQAIELVENSDYIDQDTRNKLPKISITNIERLLGTPEARGLLGVEINNQQLVLKSPEDKSLARLAIVISDVAHRKIKVTQLDTRDQRIEYAQSVATRPLPKPYTRSKDGTDSDTSSQTGKGGRPIPPDRKYLIPRQLKLVIPHTRINKLYWELQRLDLGKFINACSVMFRVFVEMSADDYAQRKGISLTYPVKSNIGLKAKQPIKEISLRKKLITISNYMENQNICSKDELRGIRTLVNNREHVLSVDNLNAYVHNKDYSPTPSDLKGNWDSIQVFVQRLCSV